MARTIQVSEETYRALRILRERLGARSFDEVIRGLVFRELGVSEDMFGVDQGRVSPFKPEDRMEDRE